MTGVGRGAILRKMMDSAQLSDEDMDPLHSFKSPGFLTPFGRGTSLMTPSQFMKSTSSALAKNGSLTQLKDDSQANDAILTPEEDSSCEESNKRMFKLTMQESDDYLELLDEATVPITKENLSREIQDDTNEKHNFSIENTEHNGGENFFSIPEQKTNAVENFFAIPEQKAIRELDTEESTLQSKAKDFSPVKSTERTEERTEDEKWEVYQVERKINKVIKSITLNNLGDMFEELECLIEERPLSSRYMNCSEVQLLLNALMKNAVQNAEFLPLAPCLIKMVSEHQPIEFKQYFPEICDAKCQEYVTLSASDEYLNKNGQHFCKLLGHLFAMPRQTGPTLFNTISTVVGEYVEQWTCPEGTEVVVDGLQTYRLLIEATAIRYLLLEITHKMLSCDREVETEMEKFVWFMRESVLNVKVPKKVREIYLDGLIEIQTTSGDGSSISASAYGIFLGTNGQSESEADISFETETDTDDKVKIDDCSGTEMENIQSDVIKLETDDNNVTRTKEENDNFDFETLGNPPIDTIAMAPRIENAYDSTATIPKGSTTCVGGFGKMAMTFVQPMWTNNLANTEDNDDDVIIEDEGNVDTIGDENPDRSSNILNVDDDDDNGNGNDAAEKSISTTTNDSFICNKNINRSQNNNPYIAGLPPKKKLPLGRGRGLARLPDFCGGNYSEKPVANVNPIGYSPCQATDKSHNSDNILYSREERSNIYRGTDNMPPHRRGGFNNNTRAYKPHEQFGGMSNNDSKTYNPQHQRVFYNETRTENFNRSRDMRTDNFQNHRGGGPGNRGNYSNRNAVNSTQGNNMLWKDKNKRFKNDNQKYRKTNFRPINHKKNTTPIEDQCSASTPAVSMTGQSKNEQMEKFYHPNGRLEYKVKTPQRQEFGSVIPNKCLRCNSGSHLAEECPVDNLFF